MTRGEKKALIHTPCQSSVSSSGSGCSNAEDLPQMGAADCLTPSSSDTLRIVCCPPPAHLLPSVVTSPCPNRSYFENGRFKVSLARQRGRAEPLGIQRLCLCSGNVCVCDGKATESPNIFICKHMDETETFAVCPIHSSVWAFSTAMGNHSPRGIRCKTAVFSLGSLC